MKFALLTILLSTSVFCCELHALAKRGKKYDQGFQEYLERYKKNVDALNCGKATEATQCQQQQLADLTLAYNKRVQQMKQEIIDVEYQAYGCPATQINEVIKLVGVEQ